MSRTSALDFSTRDCLGGSEAFRRGGVVAPIAPRNSSRFRQSFSCWRFTDCLVKAFTRRFSCAWRGSVSRIFISHSSGDDFEAIALQAWLASEGWEDVFLDLDPDRGIVAGATLGAPPARSREPLRGGGVPVVGELARLGLVHERIHDRPSAQQKAVRRSGRPEQGAQGPPARTDRHVAGGESRRRPGHAAVSRAAARIARGEACRLQSRRPDSTETWPAESGARPALLRLAPGERANTRPLPWVETARSRGRRHLLRPRRADRRSDGPVAWPRHRGATAIDGHPRGVGRRQIVVSARRAVASTDARRHAFRDTARRSARAGRLCRARMGSCGR